MLALVVAAMLKITRQQMTALAQPDTAAAAAGAAPGAATSSADGGDDPRPQVVAPCPRTPRKRLVSFSG